MSTHETENVDRSPRALRIPFWKPLILVALLPLAGACTDTVTGLDQIDHEEETSTIDDLSEDSDRPVAL